MTISTIKDIAKETGLGLATISSYLNGGNVRPHNKVLIEDAIEKLDYRVNEVARSLKTAKTRTVGVVIPDLGDVYFSNVVSQIGSCLNDKNYGMLVVDFGLDKEHEVEAIDFLCSKQVDGIIDMPSNQTGEHLRIAQKYDTPIVLFDRHVEGEDLVTVKTDNVEAIDIAVKYLYDHGHRKIGFLSGNQTITTAKERELGFKLACEKYGLKLSQDFIVRSDYITEQSVAKAFEELIKRDLDITAVIASNMISTVGALQAMNGLNLKVKRDLSFVGFDYLQLATAYHPQLTIILQSVATIAERIVTEILNKIENPEDAEADPETEIKIEPYLFEGRSVKKIKA